MATSMRASFLVVALVGVGAVAGLGGCVCNPPAPTPSADFSACLLASNASKEKLVRGQCYVFHAPETLGEIGTYSVFVDSELRVIARGCGGGGGGGGGGQFGNGGGGGGGSNFASDAVSLPASSEIVITVGKGGRGGYYRSRNQQCESGPDKHNDSIPVDHGCAGQRGEPTFITTKNFRFEFKGGEGGGGAHEAVHGPKPASIGGKAIWLGGPGGSGGVSATQANAGSVLAAGNGTGSLGEFGASAGSGGSILKVNERARILSGGGGGGGGFKFSKKNDEGKGGDGAHPEHSKVSGVTGKEAGKGNMCAGGGGGAGWEGTALHSLGGNGGDGILILDLR